MNKKFILAGRAIFTLEIPVAFQLSHETKPHYTYRVQFKKGSGQYPNDVYFVGLLTGPDNTKDYSYLGLLDKDTAAVRLTAKSCVTSEDIAYNLLCRALKRVWADQIGELTKHGFDIHHEGRCGRCGRVLTTPDSVKLGIGPECLKYIQMPQMPTAVHGQVDTTVEEEVLDDCYKVPELQTEQEFFKLH